MSSPLTQQLSAALMPGRIQRQDTVHLQPPVPVPVKPKTRLQLKETDWTSIYIPQIPDTLYLDGVIGQEEGGTTPMHELVLEWLVQTNLELGQVSRIDYVTRASVGSAPPSKSAFVHMSHWNDTPHVRNFRQTLETKGAWKLASAIDKMLNNKVLQIMDTVGGKPVPRYLSLKINVAPIPDADASLNVHQLAVAKAALEQQVANLTEANKKLETDLEAFANMLRPLATVENNATDLAAFIDNLLQMVRPELCKTFYDHYSTVSNMQYISSDDDDEEDEDTEYPATTSADQDADQDADPEPDDEPNEYIEYSSAGTVSW